MENFRNIVCTKTPIPVFACSGTDPLALTAPILGLRRAGQPMAVPIRSRRIGRRTGSYGYLFDSRASCFRTSPAPNSGILVRTAD